MVAPVHRSIESSARSRRSWTSRKARRSAATRGACGPPASTPPGRSGLEADRRGPVRGSSETARTSSRVCLAASKGARTRCDRDARAGYVLRMDHDASDLHRFEQLASDGAELVERGRAEDGATLLRESLALWRRTGACRRRRRRRAGSRGLAPRRAEARRAGTPYRGRPRVGATRIAWASSTLAWRSIRFASNLARSRCSPCTDAVDRLMRAPRIGRLAASSSRNSASSRERSSRTSSGRFLATTHRST